MSAFYSAITRGGSLFDSLKSTRFKLTSELPISVDRGDSILCKEDLDSRYNRMGIIPIVSVCGQNHYGFVVEDGFILKEIHIDNHGGEEGAALDSIITMFNKNFGEIYHLTVDGVKQSKYLTCGTFILFLVEIGCEMSDIWKGDLPFCWIPREKLGRTP